MISVGPDHLLSLFLLLVGVSLVGIAMLLLVSRERTYIPRFGQILEDTTLPPAGGSVPSSALPRACVALIAISFLAVGLVRIENWGMSHVESYVPGLPLPPGVSEPPPRHGLALTVFWHWHSEPHPPGYFLVMWVWTALFGTSLTAIRMPSLLLGCLSVILAYLVGARTIRSAWGGVLAAALVAANGHHLRWALMARPYEMAMAFGLLSTWLWLRILWSRRPNLAGELAYAASLVAGLACSAIAWVFLAAQVLYTVAIRMPRMRLASRALYFQVLAILVATPLLFHALYTGRSVNSGGEPTWSFTQHFFTFGFLFSSDDYRRVDAPAWLQIALGAVAVGSLVLFLRKRAYRVAEPPEALSLPALGPLVLTASGLACVLLGLQREAWGDRQSLALLLMPVVPGAVLLGYVVARAVRAPEPWPRLGLAAGLSPLPILTVFTLLLTYALSAVQPAAVSRALLLAVPPLLVAQAGGLFIWLSGQRKSAIPALALVLGSCVYSLAWRHDFGHDRDYRGLAQALEERFDAGDLLFVRHQDWRTTPLFYHLPAEHGRLVSHNYRAAADRAERIWVTNFDGETITPAMAKALDGFVEVDAIRERRAVATLFVRGP